jgi:site-specific recombinase XerD
MHVNIPIVDRFIAYLADERHFSPYTGRCYAMDLSQYTDFLAAHAKFSVDMGAEKTALESRKADAKGRNATSPCWRAMWKPCVHSWRT